MTAKRYDVMDKEEPRGQSVTYDGIPCTARHCCTNLNRLTEENEQLKKELDKLKLVNEMLSMDFSNSEHELWRENEQLKTKNFAYLQDMEVYKEENTHLKLENEQLKAINKYLIEILEHNGATVEIEKMNCGDV